MGMGTLDPRLEDIFARAMEIAEARERAAFVERACGGDERLRQEVLTLLLADQAAGHFMKAAPAAGQANALPSEKAGDRIGRYKLLEQLGEGGFGVVWMAEQEEPVRRRVALKIIKLGMDTKEVVARFEAERQALAMMDHPNIAIVLDGGATDTGRPYFVMELVPGVPITDYCDANQLSTPERLELFMRVCQAVQHAHQKGVIHRDLKPSNILVTVKDGRPVPKVIDFGVAKATQAPLTGKTLFTGVHRWIGTPAYMSPEQAGLGRPDVDTRSDIYSLGVLLYELLTGRTPFDAQQLLEAGYDAVMRTIREEPPPKPSTRLSALAAVELNAVAASRGAEPARLHRLVRGDLDWIVMKCLEKNRVRRYETANALALDLEHHLHHQPVTAAAPTLAYRLAKFACRNRMLLAAVSSFALLLLTGTVVSVWQALVARENLAAAYLATARASLTSGQPGRRFAALEAVAKAAAIRPSSELRSAAASALALVDVRTVREWEGLLPGTTAIILDRRFERYARNQGEQGPVSVRRVRDDQELRSLQGPFAPEHFSPDGRFLLGLSCAPPRFCVWDLETGRLVLESAMSQYCPGPDFHPHAPVLAACGAAGTVEFFDLVAGKRWAWPVANVPPGVVRFRPDGKQMALSSWAPPGVRVYDVDSGALVTSLPHSNVVRTVDWSPDGRWLAAPCADGRVYVWDLSQGGTLDRVLAAHDAVVTSVCFDPQGEFLVSRSWDGTTALWSLPSYSLVFKLPGSKYPLSFSADGRWIGPYVAGRTVSLLEVERAPEHRILRANVVQEGNGTFSPDGRWVVLGGDGLQCWNTRTGHHLWSEPAGHVRYVTFQPAGTVLLTLSPTGARAWPWQVDPATEEPRLGPPRRLTGSWGTQAEYSRDGSALVISQRDGLWVSDPRAPAPKLLPMPMCNFATLSPDGRWAAATSWGGVGMKIWELSSGREVFCLTNSFPMIGFTRDGRWLVLAREEVFRCLEVGTWRTVADGSQEHPLILAHALSADSRWVAVEQGQRKRIDFCELPTLRPLLTLTTAGGFPLCFSEDGARLLTRRSGGEFGLWNLRLIREELTPLGLGW